MPSEVPRTVKAVDTAQLLRLDAEAVQCGLSRTHGVAWLSEHVHGTATHYLWPALVHRLEHRPEYSPHWRCMLLLTVRDGTQIFSLLDVLPASFDQLPETLDAATKTKIAQKLMNGPLQTYAEWAEHDGT
ncbi:hypothetical protein GCM10009555_065920 [Acrocarpospora macrocephala]|uniref:Uncharacterized protein n=1 Tax=Acrocarpospora macrocephala TaxID=150177 RepID=A0A5M3WWW6_9ACTN|nr:hypothetical protein [Acrocarpospora macrocephala]GES13424.1 hypothetical protein Amac_070210 [Acrocarpospora macrocephala]